MPRPTLYAMPRKQDVQASIDACLANGDRLMDDAIHLEFSEEEGTRHAICMLAQEEYARAFLLYLVRDELCRGMQIFCVILRCGRAMGHQQHV